MSTATAPETTGSSLTDQTASALSLLDRLLDVATRAVREKVVEDGKISPVAMEREQRATHGLAWLATYVEALRQLDAYAVRLITDRRFGKLEELIVRIGFSEYLAQIIGGIPMN